MKGSAKAVTKEFNTFPEACQYIDNVMDSSTEEQLELYGRVEISWEGGD